MSEQGFHEQHDQEYDPRSVEKTSIGTPRVFISSTCEDLGPYRAAAREAAIRAGFYPDMSDDWAAKDTLPLDECLAKVAGDDVLVVIVAHRFGWVPEDQTGAEADRKSITWLECEAAKAQGMDVLAFLVDEDHRWDDKLRENYRYTTAGDEGKLTPELVNTIQRDIRRLQDFKEWFRQGLIVKTFTTEADLAAKVESALRQWRADHLPSGPKPALPKVYDPTRYLEVLCERTAHIDIRGLAVGSGKAMRFPIEELYIPLTTSASDTDRRALRRNASESEEPAGHTELHEALQNQHLVIVGDPGAGKTTFLRRIAQLLCRSLLAKDPQEVTQKLGLPGTPFPLCIRASDLARHMRAMGKRGIGPAQPNAPFWLAHFLDAESKENETALTEEFFREQLRGDRAIVLLDGLDEASSQEDRKMLIGLIEAVVPAYPQARFVVTSRPAAYQGDVVLAGFSQVWIDRLEDPAIEHFLRRWSGALFPDSPHLAESHWRELAGALAARPDIRRIVRNPVMLTALAVVHWHEKLLPEQRADLYESILLWLAKSRESRPGRPDAKRCVALLQELALAMHDAPGGRRVQVSAHLAAEMLNQAFAKDSPAEALDKAREFIRDEELDSGIVVGHGDKIRFWHLTFQEYLAARAVAGLSEDKQRQLLLCSPKLYDPEWREVVLLLAGILHHQGPAKVDAMFSAVLDETSSKRSGLWGTVFPWLRGRANALTARAHCVGLLGAVARDLTPVGYRVCDPRYQEMLDQVLGIFDVEQSKSIPIAVAIEAADALGQAGDPRFDDLDSNWITIPAGEFWMGAQRKCPLEPNYDPEADSEQWPVHRVHLSEYQISRYPVTVGEYRLFIEAGGYEDERFWQAGGFGEYKEPKVWEDQLAYPTRPVVNVSWHEACAYAAWAGAALATEAQWEHAARGSDRCKFPWGNEDADASLLNFDGKVGHTTPVGLYPRGATPEGICDLAGNVFEWCADWYGSYAADKAADPTGPTTGSFRALRGGGWYDPAGSCQAAVRHWSVPLNRVGSLGFRLARVPPNKQEAEP